MSTVSVYSFCIIFYLRTYWVCIVSVLLVACSAPSHCLKRWRFIVNWTFRNELHRKFNKEKQNASFLKMHLKMKWGLRNGGHFVQFGDELTISVILFVLYSIAPVQFCPIWAPILWHQVYRYCWLNPFMQTNANSSMAIWSDSIHKVITNLVVHIWFI